MTITRTRIRTVFAFLVAVLAGCLSTAPAGASRDHRQATYVALGDSLAFGYSPLLEDPWIPARFVGYPELIEQQTGFATTNLACPGQTAQALVSESAVDNGCFDFRAAASEAGIEVLHTDYEGTQLDAALAAVHSETPPSLISIQGGGNEFDMCVLHNPDPTADPDACLADALPKVTASLRTAIDALRDAGYRDRIVVVGYHFLPGLERQFREMNRAIERAARGHDVAFADATTLFADYARRHDGDVCSTGLLIALPDGTCDLHPSATGQQLFADAVLRAAFGDGHEHGHEHRHGHEHKHGHEHGHGGHDGHHGEGCRAHDVDARTDRRGWRR